MSEWFQAKWIKDSSLNGYFQLKDSLEVVSVNFQIAAGFARGEARIHFHCPNPIAGQHLTSLLKKEPPS